MLKRFIIIAIILLYSVSAYAQSAGNTVDPKTPYGPGISRFGESGGGSLKVAFDFDWTFNKDLDAENNATNAETDGQMYLLRIGYDVADRFEPYIKLGGSHIRASWDQYGSDIKVKGKDGFVFAVGAKTHLFEIPEHKIRFSLNGEYLYTNPDIKKATVNVPNRSISSSEFEVSQWQIAGIASMEFVLNYDTSDSAAVYSLIPYLGLAYFDSLTKAKFTYSGTEYNIGDANNDSKFLLITGCDMNSPENISLNVEGRWIGETAASGGCTVKF